MAKLFIKICGITNIEDALTSIDAGADALGFNFYEKSPRYIEPSKARIIVERLTGDVMTVGVFVNERHSSDVVRIADQAGVDAIQLHGDETPAFCRELAGRYLIKALRTTTDFEPKDAASFETDAILLDAYSDSERGGTGRTIDWSIARKVRESVPQLILAGGLSPDNISQALEAVDPFGVDACSSLELRPGVKDPVRIRAFIDVARARKITS